MSRIRVTLAVAESEGVWNQEDVLLDYDPENQGEAGIEDAASSEWERTNPRRTVAFLKLFFWEYEDEDEYAGGELNIYPGDVAARDSF